ncbi:hypothetical protein D3C78_1559570 [compost metagenome]
MKVRLLASLNVYCNEVTTCQITFRLCITHWILSEFPLETRRHSPLVRIGDLADIPLSDEVSITDSPQLLEWIKYQNIHALFLTRLILEVVRDD